MKKVRMIQARTSSRFGSLGLTSLEMNPDLLCEGLVARAVDLRERLKATPMDKEAVVKQINETQAILLQISTAIGVDLIQNYNTWLSESSDHTHFDD